MRNDKLEIFYADPRTLSLYKNNAKMHDDKQIAQIVRSIKEFGFNDPIAVDEDNTIIEGHGSLQGLIQAMQNSQNGNRPSGYGFNGNEGNGTGDYTDNNNPALLKWQQQSDDNKVSRYLAKIGKQQTPAQDAEGYAYHQSQFQNMVIDQNLNAPVYAKLNAADFNQYCQQNGLTPIYRGWESGQSSKDRFENAAMSHTGAGRYGEGFYFADKSTARGYNGGALSVCALSPAARVVDLSTVQSRINASGARAAFNRSGQVASSRYRPNMGESQMALKMGYNVIRTSWCYVVLTRDAVVVRK